MVRPASHLGDHPSPVCALSMLRCNRVASCGSPGSRLTVISPPPQSRTKVSASSRTVRMDPGMGPKFQAPE